MQRTNTVLEVLSRRGSSKQPVERLHRQLYNIELYELAYAQIYANRGATTRGIDEDTLDGTSISRLENIIEEVKSGTYQWKPTRRTYIPKKGGERPLGIPTGTDKLLQTAMKILLASYYEPRFSERSHGFRQGRGCHTALIKVRQKFKGTKWFIEGDIKGCFDNIDHKILMEILADDIKDNRFLKLIRNLLKAGYMEGWTRYDTYSGTPQGGVISPLLANIYLNKLDEWVEKSLLPHFNRSHDGKGGRRKNPEYNRLNSAAWRASKKGDNETARMLRRKMKSMPSLMVDDQEYRKLEYIRYADDFVLGFIGHKHEAKDIKREIGEFLKDRLNLEMSDEKTLITHAGTEKARFLGYELGIMHSKHRRTVNGTVWFGVPKEVVTENVRKYTYKGEKAARPEMLENSDYEIIGKYQAEYRGLVNYYCMAHNIHRQLNRVNWACQSSLLRTLARKHKSTIRKTMRKYAGAIVVDGRTYKVITARVERKDKGPLIAHYGGIPLRRKSNPAQINDNKWKSYTRYHEVLERLNADECEMCGRVGPVEMHHRNPMRNVNKKGKNSLPAWRKKMIAMRRITLAVCWPCHKAITYGDHKPEWDVYLEKLRLEATH
jgi:group II intron reverse transcriptase/maturase